MNVFIPPLFTIQVFITLSTQVQWKPGPLMGSSMDMSLAYQVFLPR